MFNLASFVRALQTDFLQWSPSKLGLLAIGLQSIYVSRSGEWAYVVAMLDLVIGVQAGGAAIGGAHWLIACVAVAQFALLGHCADAHDGHAAE